MPIGFIVSGECPPNGVPVQAGFHVDVVADVAVVIVIDEWMMAYRVVKRERCNYEE